LIENNYIYDHINFFRILQNSHLPVTNNIFYIEKEVIGILNDEKDESFLM